MASSSSSSGARLELNPESNTPMHTAVLQNNLVELEKLIRQDIKKYSSSKEKKSDVNIQSLGNTPLLLALKTGSIEAASLLLTHPAIDVTLKDDSIEDALDWACFLRQDEIIHSILDRIPKDKYRDILQGATDRYLGQASSETVLPNIFFHLENILPRLVKFNLEDALNRDPNYKRLLRSEDKRQYLVRKFLGIFLKYRNGIEVDKFTLTRLVHMEHPFVGKMKADELQAVRSESKAAMFSPPKTTKINLPSLAELLDPKEKKDSVGEDSKVEKKLGASSPGKNK